MSDRRKSLLDYMADRIQYILQYPNNSFKNIFNTKEFKEVSKGLLK